MSAVRLERQPFDHDRADGAKIGHAGELETVAERPGRSDHGISQPETSADLDRHTFDLAGTRLDLADFRSPQAEAAGPLPAATAPASARGWWAHFELAEGHLKTSPTPTVQGRFTVHLRDSVPLVGLFETRKNLPHWVERLLTVQDIRAGGTIAWSRSETSLDNLFTQLRQATIRSRNRARSSWLLA